GGRPQEDICDKYDVVDNGKGKHRGACCRYCSTSWARGRAQDIKSHLALKCKERVPRKVQTKLLWDIQISVFDCIYFKDYTKILNPGYNSPKRTSLASSILDKEAVNITLKIEKELSKSENLTLCVDSWCIPMKHSIYAFVIITDNRKQYVHLLCNFSIYSHTANFNAEKILEVLEKVGPEKFVTVVSDAESAMIGANSICCLPYAQKVLSNCQAIISFFRKSYIAGAALREKIVSSFTVGGNLKSTAILFHSNIRSVLEQEPQVFDRSITVKNLITNRQFWIDVEQLRNILGPVKRAVKDVKFRTTLLADVFVELIKMAIAIQGTSVLYNNQFWHDSYRGNFLEPGVYKTHIQKKAIEVWKQLGGGDISADFLKAQINLYKNKKYPFDNEFVASVDTITNWWMFIDLKKNEEHIKCLATKLHSISPHNAACEHVFIENIKLELNYVDQDICQEDFISIFNKIASSMEDRSDLFSEKDSFSYIEELSEQIERDVKELSELEDLVEENSTNLEVENLINLLSNLKINKSDANKEIVYRNKDFNINDILGLLSVKIVNNILKLSCLPKKATKMRTTSQDICEQILKLAKKSLTPSELCIHLWNLYNFKPVKDITMNKILRILKSHGLAPKISEDLYHLIKKAIAVRKHLEYNHHDRDAKFRLMLIKSR
ncbi:9598_t:CDS:10, partial [Dentiscutata erythropus]